MKTTAVVESLSTIQPDVLFQKSITSLLQDSINRMRNLHQILLKVYGLEAWHLFRDWERLQLRASNYKNHRIFTLRCLHKELIPVSIKLKSTLKTEKARKIIRKAEKDLLQARIKAINSILDNVAKQTEECRSQLVVSIISAQRLRECQGFIDKVGEIRFTKVKQRQLNKYNILLNKKEGNITRANATTNPSNLASQAGRQASTLLPPREGSNLTQAGAHLPSREVSSSLQAGRQVLFFPLGKEGIYLRQAGRHSPSPWGRKHFFPGNYSPSSWGRKQYLPGNCSPSSRGRKQFSTGNCSPSSRGRKQFLPGYCSSSLWGSRQFFPGSCSPSPGGR